MRGGSSVGITSALDLVLALLILFRLDANSFTPNLNRHLLDLHATADAYLFRARRLLFIHLFFGRLL
jgi:hypothetical protein